MGLPVFRFAFSAMLLLKIVEESYLSPPTPQKKTNPNRKTAEPWVFRNGAPYGAVWPTVGGDSHGWVGEVLGKPAEAFWVSMGGLT